MTPGIVDRAGRATQTRRLLAQKAQVDGLLISDLMNVQWLTGLASSNAAALVTDRRVRVVTDSRYAQQALCLDPGIDVSVDRAVLSRAVALAAQDGAVSLGIEAESLTVAMFATLQAVATAQGMQLVGVSGVIEELRATKDKAEVDALTAASEASTAALRALLPTIEVGMTEIEVARRLELEMGRCGGEDRAFPSIVASGPNSAIPHHMPGSRRVEAGDFLKIDFGAMCRGYHADCTRTFIVAGTPDRRQSVVYDAVQASAAAARAALRPGIEVAELDRIARCVLADAGFAELFTHGLGHGVGLQIHESPLIAASAAGTIPEGAVVTIEPGVYLPGEFGVRIEDTCQVTASGVTVLTDFPRELTRIA